MGRLAASAALVAPQAVGHRVAPPAAVGAVAALQAVAGEAAARPAAVGAAEGLPAVVGSFSRANASKTAKHQANPCHSEWCKLQVLYR
jgi:hypothetical protein